MGEAIPQQETGIWLWCEVEPHIRTALGYSISALDRFWFVVAPATERGCRWRWLNNDGFVDSPSLEDDVLLMKKSRAKGFLDVDLEATLLNAGDWARDARGLRPQHAASHQALGWKVRGGHLRLIDGSGA